MKTKPLNKWYGVQPLLGNLAMFITQDIVMKYFFSKKIIIGKKYLDEINGSVILAPTHRSRWDGLILTMAVGRRVTNEDCRFMVTKSEMSGLQGWFLKRLGCFSINQESPSLSSLRFAINLIVSKRQLVVFPEGKINKYGKNLPLKQGLFRLAMLAAKKNNSITIIPIGIAYSKINPNFKSKVALCFEKPLIINEFSNFSIKEFNSVLKKNMTKAEKAALNILNR